MKRRTDRIYECWARSLEQLASRSVGLARTDPSPERIAEHVHAMEDVLIATGMVLDRYRAKTLSASRRT